ncbi:MAG: hypothetical protein U0R50_16020 [Gaiellales bacterium]
MTPLATDRLVAGVLAALGALAGIPLVLAQLDFAGVVDVFSIEHGDVAHGLIVLATIAAAATGTIVAAGLAGAALCLAGSAYARPVLTAVAIAGFATALMLWLPIALTLGAAVHLLGRAEQGL